MIGHLTLELAPNALGRTVIAAQSFRAPMHLSKPHWDGRHLIVQSVNCTAGLFSGDRVALGLRALPGSSTVVTSPSAGRSFQAREGEEAALVTQEIAVSAGAWLEFFPEIFIPHQRSRAAQRTRLEVEPGGEMLFVEALAPGRVAAGEAFRYESLDWTTELFLGGELTARERYCLTPGGDAVEALRAFHPTAYYASCYFISPRLTPAFRAEIAALSRPGALLAASFLASDAVIIKVLAQDSLLLRQALRELRERCYVTAARSLPDWRKL